MDDLYFQECDVLQKSYVHAPIVDPNAAGDALLLCFYLVCDKKSKWE